ncbi:vitelline membrane outer layer protein 1 homolog [Pseudorasbora parva]|uniref:vitelline membrane outer layer protein 1 homolog n=1 Tax=Pseudorasbora parva TaxID=51549 RepID=UPI00351EB587
MSHFFFIVISLLAIIGQHVSAQTVERRKRSSSREVRSVMFVTNGGPWGTWRAIDVCPYGTYAAGFSLRVENPINGDDTALNGIRLYCADWSRGFVSSIESDTGYWGDWTDVKWCFNGYLKAFQLRVESRKGKGDDTAANNIRFWCSDGSWLEGDGTSWGDWGDWSQTCWGKGICGLSTRIEEKQGKGDDTALNDVHMYCCD